MSHIKYLHLSSMSFRSKSQGGAENLYMLYNYLSQICKQSHKKMTHKTHHNRFVSCGILLLLFLCCKGDDLNVIIHSIVKVHAHEDIYKGISLQLFSRVIYRRCHDQCLQIVAHHFVKAHTDNDNGIRMYFCTNCLRKDFYLIQLHS